MPEEEALQLRETSDGIQVIYRGRRLYSESAPRAAARRRGSAIPVAPETLYLVPSPLLGYGLTELLERLPETSHLFCVELDETLGEITVAPPEDSAGRVTFAIARGGESAWREAAQALLNESYRRVVTVTLSGGGSLHHTQYEEIAATLDRALRQTWQNRMTTIRLGRSWARNFLINLGYSGPDGDSALLREEKPVVVVGPSESLELALPVLSRLRRMVAVFALDTALPILRESGLAPDYVVSVDAQHANALDFVGIRHVDYALIADLTVHPAVPRHHRRASPRGVYWFTSRGFESSLVSRARMAGLLPFELPAVGSVAVAAVYLALRMTGKNVYLTGLDFCYTPGKPYARGAPLQRQSQGASGRLSQGLMYALSLKRPLTRAQGHRGKPVSTDLVLLSYQQQVESLVEGHGRVRTVGTAGVDVGVPRVELADWEADMRRSDLLAGASSGDRGKQLPELGGFDAPSGGAIPRERRLRLHRFLEKELVLLREAEEALREAKSDAVERWDHAWFDFPEKQTGREVGPTFPGRLGLRLARYRRMLTQLADDAATPPEP